MCFYLYVKTHNITGLKYLGHTIRDPYKYRGSGTYWKAHLRVHKNDVMTEVIGIYETHDQMKDAGILYSKLWDVVRSDIWANLKDEDGIGGPRNIGNKFRVGHTHSIETRQMMSRARKGKTISEAHKQAVSRARSGVSFTKEHRQKLSIAARNRHNH